MNSVTCCGRTSQSAFCPLCGRRLQAFPLGDLLQEVRRMATKAEAELDKFVTKYGPECLPAGTPAANCRIRLRLSGPPRPQARRLAPSESQKLDRLLLVAAERRSWACALERLMVLADQLPPDADAAPEPAPGPGSVPATDRNLDI